MFVGVISTIRFELEDKNYTIAIFGFLMFICCLILQIMLIDFLFLDGLIYKILTNWLMGEL